MNDIRFASDSVGAVTIDHRTGSCRVGTPLDSFRRVERPTVRPNYGARRVGAAGVIVAGLFLAAQVLAAAATFFGSSTVLADGVLADGVLAERVLAEGVLVEQLGAEELVAVGESTGSWGVAQGSGTHVARDGDSLWSIADEKRDGLDRESYIDALVELNGGTSIQVGQAVLLP